MMKYCIMFGLGVLLGQASIMIAYNPKNLEEEAYALGQGSFVVGCNFGSLNMTPKRCLESGETYINRIKKGLKHESQP